MINLHSQQIYKKVNLEGVPNSVIDMKMLKLPGKSVRNDKLNNSIPPFDALLRLSSYSKDTQMQTQSPQEEFVLVKVNAKFEEPKLRYNLLKQVNYGDKDIDVIHLNQPECYAVVFYAIPSLQPTHSTPIRKLTDTTDVNKDPRNRSPRSPKTRTLDVDRRGIAIKKLQLSTSKL